MLERKIDDGKRVWMWDVLFLATLLIGLMSWLFDPFEIRWDWLKFRVSWGMRPVVASVVVGALWWVMSRRAGRSLSTERLPRVAMGLGMTLGFLGLLEGGFALAGVPRGEEVFVIHDNDGEAFRADGSMVHDRDTLWRFVPGAEFNGLTVNGQGFLGRPFATRKGSGVTRVMVLGDSCSAQGDPPYSDLLHALLEERRLHGRSWEVINTAVHGYTVLQGRALYETRGRGFEPDVVILYFGWNSHWLSEVEDAARMVSDGNRTMKLLMNGLARKRSVTWLRGLVEGEASSRVLRVSPERYREALRSWLVDLKAEGVRPVVLTAPRAEALTTALVHNRNAESVEEAEGLHDLYVDLTREVAREVGVRLVDLAGELPDVLSPRLFMRDGIHLTEEGHQWVARRLKRELAGMEW
ncbi:MAG TPA: SGNH/GDSL hydrolase family protein [Kiritimatiellia bacterium]|nr:SGNH/GDSL hydrolase family protein [Kiritimatiellia bacterium]